MKLSARMAGKGDYCGVVFAQVMWQTSLPVAGVRQACLAWGSAWQWRGANNIVGWRCCRIGDAIACMGGSQHMCACSRWRACPVLEVIHTTWVAQMAGSCLQVAAWGCLTQFGCFFDVLYACWAVNAL